MYVRIVSLEVGLEFDLPVGAGRARARILSLDGSESMRTVLLCINPDEHTGDCEDTARVLASDLERMIGSLVP